MPWQYRICPRTLHFKEPAGTSRGVYTTRDVWYIVLFNRTKRCFGVGECAPLPDLSCDAGPDYEKRLDEVCQTFVKSGDIHSVPEDCPSMRFGLETALLHARAESVRFFRTPFSRGSEDLAINGLVWMGDRDTMKARIETKLAQGFRCIKCKIGGIDFESELELLASIRERFPDPAELELRLDANGAFSVEEAPARLEALAKFAPHSIEQPIRQGQWEAMAELCRTSPIPIALDEELINVPKVRKADLMDCIRPQYLVLKPSLHGGLRGCEQWMDQAASHECGCWVTSALESNIGLNAIAQWCGTKHWDLAQGLGTGQLFTDNCEIMPLRLQGSGLHCNPEAPEPDLLAWLGINTPLF